MPSNHLILSTTSFHAFNLSQHQSLFKWVGSSHLLAKLLELQLQHQSFQWILRVDFLHDWLVWFPCCSRDSHESSPTPRLNKASVLRCSAFFMVLLSHPYTTTGNTRVLTRRIFVGRVMSLFSKMASRFVTAFITSPFLMVQCRLVLWYWVSPDWGCGPFKAWMEKDVLPSLHMRWGWIQFLGQLAGGCPLSLWCGPLHLLFSRHSVMSDSVKPHGL